MSSGRCRTCGNLIYALSKAVRIFEVRPVSKFEPDITLAKMMRVFTQITIEKDDALPKHVCKRCSELIIMSYKFHRAVLNSEKKFNSGKFSHDLPIQSDHIKPLSSDTVNIRPLIAAPKEKVTVQVLNLTNNPPAPSNVVVVDKETVKTPKMFFPLVSGEQKAVPVHNETQVCKTCGKKFISAKYLRLHMRQFHVEVPHMRKCNVCDIDFETPALLTKHNFQVHFPTIEHYICNICKKVYKKKYTLARHKKKAHSITRKTRFHCHRCGRYFYTLKNLFSHRDSECGARSETKDNLMLDIETSANNDGTLEHKPGDEIIEINEPSVESIVKKYKDSQDVKSTEIEGCDNIQETILTPKLPDNLYDQMQVNSVKVETVEKIETTEGVDENPENILLDINKSDTMDVDDIVSVALKENVLDVSNISESSSANVNKNVSNRSDQFFEKDQSEAIPINLMIGGGVFGSRSHHKCNLCGKKFLRLYNLQKHIAFHKGGQLLCLGCKFIATNPAELKQHVTQCQMLKNSSDLGCALCKKKFTTTAGLKYHLQAHTALRQYSCSVCKKRFLTKRNVRAHVKTVHSGVRPHACDQCPRAFASLDHLKKHITSAHAKQWDYVCQSCGKKFLQSSHLNQHMWLHTGVKPHDCMHCDKKYTSKCSLTKHLRKYHREQNKDPLAETVEENVPTAIGNDENEPADNNLADMVQDLDDDVENFNILFVVQDKDMLFLGDLQDGNQGNE